VVAGCCLAAAALGLLALLLPSGQPKIALLVLFAFTGPGCAVVAQLRLADRYLRLPLILVGSLAISAALPTLMLWADWWHPRIELTALALLCALSGCVALRRRRAP
jgi:hypothetical protein